ncbi:hypothetical protein B0T20DRAFT_121587 [Sordaria brevicollis]|uniref:Uncharacterized protein n=1 Tax=Sordaria brevicollis TaxID=83679 RepID=A0AAE0PKU1_SORBR|nr:hypothetical protein B0T20DRAFT_121587 [Sordaria brevicollis]
MQPFLSGEATLAWLLITLTLLLFAAAGDEHPYEPSYRKYPAEAGRSSVEIGDEQQQPAVKAEELTVRLEDLQQQSGKEQSVVRRNQKRTQVVRRGGYKVPLRYASKPSPSSSYFPSGFKPRSLQVLAVLLSHQSLHTINIPVLGKSVGPWKAEVSWSLGGLGLAGGLPLMKTVRGGKTMRSLKGCRGSKSLKYVGVSHEDVKKRRPESGNDESVHGQLEAMRSIGRAGEVGD